MSSAFQHDLQQMISLLQSYYDGTSHKELRHTSVLLRHLLLHFLQQHQKTSAELAWMLADVEKMHNFTKDVLASIIESLKKEYRANEVPCELVTIAPGTYQINAANWLRLKSGLQSVLRRTKDSELSSLIGEGGVLDEKLSSIVEQTLVGRPESKMLQWHGRDISIGCEMAPVVSASFQQIWDMLLNQKDVPISAGDIHLVVLDHAVTKTIDIYIKDFVWAHYLPQIEDINKVGMGINVFLHQWRGRSLLRMTIPGQTGREKVFCFSISGSLYAFSLQHMEQIKVVTYLGDGVIETHDGIKHKGLAPMEFGTADGQWYPLRGRESLGMAIWPPGQNIFLIDDAHGVTWASREAAGEGRHIACTTDGRRMPMVGLDIALKKIA